MAGRFGVIDRGWFERNEIPGLSVVAAIVWCGGGEGDAGPRPPQREGEPPGSALKTWTFSARSRPPSHSTRRDAIHVSPTRSSAIAFPTVKQIISRREMICFTAFPADRGSRWVSPGRRTIWRLAMPLSFPPAARNHRTHASLPSHDFSIAFHFVKHFISRREMICFTA